MTTLSIKSKFLKVYKSTTTTKNDINIYYNPVSGRWVSNYKPIINKLINLLEEIKKEEIKKEEIKSLELLLLSELQFFRNPNPNPNPKKIDLYLKKPSYNFNLLTFEYIKQIFDSYKELSDYFLEEISNIPLNKYPELATSITIPRIAEVLDVSTIPLESILQELRKKTSTTTNILCKLIHETDTVENRNISTISLSKILNELPNITKITVQKATHITQITNLLYIQEILTETDSLVEISNCPELINLTVSSKKFSNLKQVPKLVSLELRETRIESLRNFQNLEKIKYIVDSRNNDYTIQVISNCPMLSIIDINNYYNEYRCSNKSTISLGNLTRLKRLILSHITTIDKIVNITSVDNLEIIRNSKQPKPHEIALIEKIRKIQTDDMVRLLKIPNDLKRKISEYI